MKDRPQEYDSAGAIRSGRSPYNDRSEPADADELSEAVERAKIFAAQGLPERTRALLDGVTDMDQAERAELLAEAYEIASRRHRRLAVGWRSVKPSDPLSKHVIGYADKEDREADRASEIADVQRLYAVEYRRLAGRTQEGAPSAGRGASDDGTPGERGEA